MIRTIILALIRFYRGFVSPFKPPTCRFTPSCSHYAMECVETHGARRGLALAAWRILRCNPFVRGGHDPVPSMRLPRP